MTIINSRYEILEILGEGGVGITYKAKDIQTDRFVAVKVISFRQVSDWKTLNLFEREVRVLQQLNHPAIPQYLDSFEIDTEDDRLFYIVQALAPGQTLAQWMQQGWQPDEETVRSIATQVLDILVYLQNLTPAIVHRDIKPQNILRDDRGQIYLVDFGAVQDTYRQTVTGGSTVIGTFGYMAPEQFRGQATLATDLYGLGTTLAFLLTGKDPIDLPQTDALKLQLPPQIQLSLPFKRWLDRILEPAAEDRFPSAESALLALEGHPQSFVSESRSTQRPKDTKISLIISDNHLRIRFFNHNANNSKTLKLYLGLGLCFIDFFCFGLFCWIIANSHLNLLTLTGRIVSITSCIISSLTVISLAFFARILQILLKPTVLIFDRNSLNLRGVLKPLGFYQEENIQLTQISRVRLKKSGKKAAGIAIEIGGEEEYQIGYYLSPLEQRWLVSEIQDFLENIKRKTEEKEREKLELLKDSAKNALHVLLERGIEAHKEKMNDDAEILFKAAILLEPTCPEAYNNLGVTYFLKEKYTQAKEAFEKALDYAPGYWNAKVCLAKTYEAQGDVAKSIEISLNPCPQGKLQGLDEYTLILAPEWNLRCTLSRGIDFFKEASLSKTEKSVLYQQEYAYLLHLQGNSEVALEIYHQAIKSALNNPKYLFVIYGNLGWTLTTIGRIDEALVYLNKSKAIAEKENDWDAQKIKALINYYSKKS